jgi:hypothetical protein
MRKITTAITAAALALSMVAQAIPAAAIVGYDSSYAGETAFLNVSPGQTVNFQVFFANTGTTTWTRNTGTQVDLAACLEDKVSCNLQDASEAGWNSGWLSTVRYTTHTQTSVAPGAVATFSYNVSAPVGAANGIYRFNGDLVLSSTGERLHPEGYFQEANLGGVGTGGAATITDLDPDEGSTSGGDSVVITGSNIMCTPAFPSVSFGGTAAAVVSCGSTSLTVTSPAHAAGDVTVTVTNSGAAASNGLTFEYTDETAPSFVSMTVSGDLINVTFSEPVCRAAAFTSADWTVRNISAATTNTVTGDTIPDDCDDAVTTATLVLTTAVPPGALVEATLNESSLNAGENVRITDEANNPVDAPQARQATAQARETTEPDLIGASAPVGSSTITLTFSEPVYCPTTPGLTPATDITVEDEDGNDIAVTGYDPDDPCDPDRFDADTSFQISISPETIDADTTYTVTIDDTAAVKDVANNSLDNNDADFTAGAGDFSPPTIIDARMANNLGSSNFEDSGDSFTLTFSEVMNGSTTGTIDIQDQDGTIATIQCSAVTGANQASCTWNDTETVLTVSLTGLLSDSFGDTPDMQIPFNITETDGIQDVAGNPANILGSSDRLVNFE